MVREFDERNMAGSRAVCAAMAEEAYTGKRRLTERERRILDMWPRFEDTGDPVMVGDAYIDGSGDCNIIVAVRICDVCVDLVGEDGFLTGFKPGERVKRPAPEVLDADGVEIKVGDTVWHHSGFAHGVATSIDAGSLMGTVRYVNGGVEFRDAAKDLTHTRPDSWERLEEDAALSPADYIDKRGRRTDLYAYQEMPIDIVRRAKALAGVEQ